MRAKSAERSESGRDIAPLPEVVNAERKTLGERNLEFFLRTYFPGSFTLAWSADHREVIDALQSAILDGGLFAYAMPRGSGKTTMAVSAAIWAMIYGHREFVPLIAADEGAALSLLESIKSELENNDLLLEDFPEVCYPIRQLEGIAHRCNGQLFNGKRTHITWTSEEIVLPAIPTSRASSAIVRVAGITGSVRGMQFTRPDGRKVRPSLAIVDDPQTNESARSPSQTQQRIKTVMGAVLGLAGPAQTMACVITCTVIEAGDLADQLLNREKFPDWQGKRAKLMYALPTNDKLWEQYASIRADSLRAGNGGKEATEFYSANREAMDAGGQAAWPVRFNKDEISATQHAMNLKIKLGDAFDAEYQNEPRRDDLSIGEVTADEIAARLNRVPRGIVPVESQHVTAFIDVQGSLLYYVVAAIGENFQTNIIDYGAWPDQNRNYFTLNDAKKTLQRAYPSKSQEAIIYEGLNDLVNMLAAREWRRAAGGTQRIGKLLIDANWGQSTDTVYRFCRQSSHAAIITPSHGKYIGASSRPFSQYARQKGELIGDEWMIPSVKGRRAIRHVLIDTNHWKTFTHARFAAPIGDACSIMLFGDNQNLHRMYADQQVSEYRVRTEGRGRKVDEWKLRPNKPDNHLFDCTVGCLVAASMLGIRVQSPQTIKPTQNVKARRKVHYFDN